MSTITAQFDLHTRLFHNVVAGISDDRAGVQPGSNMNHLKFLAGHLVYTRLMLKDFGGLAADDRFNQFDKNIDGSSSYLPMAEIVAKWDEISGPIAAGMNGLPAEALAGPGPFPSPMGGSLEECLGFLMHHEAYHLGQLGTLRRLAGVEAMKYS